jgi:hypothetical protein
LTSLSNLEKLGRMPSIGRKTDALFGVNRRDSFGVSAGITIINRVCSLEEMNLLSVEYSTRNASGAVEGKLFAPDRVARRERERVISKA